MSAQSLDPGSAVKEKKAKIVRVGVRGDGLISTSEFLGRIVFILIYRKGRLIAQVGILRISTAQALRCFFITNKQRCQEQCGERNQIVEEL